MTQIGVILPHLQNSQLAYLVLNQMNTIVAKGDHECIAFYKDVSYPCVKTTFAHMNMTEINSFNGLLVATDLDSAEAMLKSPLPCDKALYVWDLEWLRRGMDNFARNVGIYRDPRFTLISRSESHAKQIQNYCNRKVDAIIPNIYLLGIYNEVYSTTD